MRAAEARDMTVDQLKDKLIQLKKEQFNLRFQKASGQLERTTRIGEVRRDISRVKTIIREKSAPAAN